jgi:hypothetical protein
MVNEKRAPIASVYDKVGWVTKGFLIQNVEN